MSLSVIAMPRHAAGRTIWGLAGGYARVDLADAHRRGVRAVLVEAQWAVAEPARGQFNHAYLGRLADEVHRYRAMGFHVALNYGLQNAPQWVMRIPGARYVNQHGAAFTAGPLPDLIFDTSLRPFAQAYTDVILGLLGRSVYMVRVGGGYWGELGYPPPASGEPDNQYWAFGQAARRSAPRPAWRPCSPGTPRQQRAFLTWYLASLVNYQTWQVRSVRRVYSGQIAVLYPSVGFTAADEKQALADHLCGRSTIERTGAIARGWDHAQQVRALSGPGLVVYSTDVNNPSAIDQLGQLAATRRLPLAGENAGFNDAAAMRTAVREARMWRLTSFFWIRAQQAYCRCNAWATIEDYQHDIVG